MPLKLETVITAMLITYVNKLNCFKVDPPLNYYETYTSCNWNMEHYWWMMMKCSL